MGALGFRVDHALVLLEHNNENYQLMGFFYRGWTLKNIVIPHDLHVQTEYVNLMNNAFISQSSIQSTTYGLGQSHSDVVHT